MATTIKSTDLDFEQIKNNLKLFLAQTDEFRDYNFEASGVSALLDVLAYNTHYNSLLANFALNESFLSTAQLRSSLVSLAGALGYQVGSRYASCATVNLYVTNPLVPSTMTLPEGFRFTTTVNNKAYVFKTRDALVATNNGSNQYYFRLGENQNLLIHEGTEQRKVFIAGPAGENQSYVIPTENVDLNTVEVRVYKDVNTSLYDVYTNINDAINIDKNSRIYVMKETPNGQYELTFGNGTRLGLFPETGNKIEIIYDSVAGPDANGARTFTPLDSVLDADGTALTLNVITVHKSTAGSLKEPLASIRKNAPYLYSAQNRMVTAQDYAALSKRNYGQYIADIKAWGGEDNVPPNYGFVYLSIVFNSKDTALQAQVKSDIQNLAANLSVASFAVNFTDPVTTFLEVDAKFQWNPNLTSSTKTAIETETKSTIEQYFLDQLGGFDKSFRRSNMLTLIDDTDPSILSSRAEIKMQFRFVPVVGQVSYDIVYPSGIATPEAGTYIVRSDNFSLSGQTCYLRNRLDSTVIEVISLSTGLPILDNIGEYDPTTGIITLSNFSGTIITGDHIKIRAIPANQSLISASRNNILAFDNAASKVTAILTDTV